MGQRRRAFTTATLLALGACTGGGERASDEVVLLPPLTAVRCTDAAHLRQRALDDRRKSDELSSDQQRITLGDRANFFASLAVIAALTCEAGLAEADSALQVALQAAREAGATSGFYATAHRWREANYLAIQAIALLTHRRAELLPE